MILVTGASRGIGLGIASRFTSLGFDVVGLARTSVAAPFPTFEVDVTDDEQVRQVALDLRRAKTFPTVVINAAGIASMNLALMTPASKARAVVGTNLLGTMFVCQAFAPLIARAGGGSIINFSTIAVALGLSGESVYAASKAGVETYTRVLARELAGMNIRANCIAPGPIDTELLRGVSDSQIDAIVKQQILPTRFTVEDICDVAEALVDKRLSSISGEVFHIGGV
jgi:3-oxoacyl-[acyl-carrier protein] reductase